MRRVLVARLDSMGDVLLAGPAVRAIAHADAEIVFVSSTLGRAAAELLPGVGQVEVMDAAWILADPPPVGRDDVLHQVDELWALEVDEAIILTSFHQSPLPMALLLRMAGVPRIAAISSDYPGSLLDVRHTVGEGVHEVERGLSVARACGYRLPPEDDRSLRVHLEQDAPVLRELPPHFVIVHPGAAAPARTWPADRFAEAVALLADDRRVVVTGTPSERRLVDSVIDGSAVDAQDLAVPLPLSHFAAVIEQADAIVTGNTGPAHLAAAVGTPVVSLFAPTVPLERWRPWNVPHVILGDQAVPCRGCRARVCPIPGQPCLAGVRARDVLRAVDDLTANTGRRPTSRSRSAA